MENTVRVERRLHGPEHAQIGRIDAVCAQFTPLPPPAIRHDGQRCEGVARIRARNVAPTLRMKPASSTAASAPMSARTRLTSTTSDSPILKRGNSAFSKTATRVAGRWRQRGAARVKPAGPAPMMATSRIPGSVVTTGSDSTSTPHFPVVPRIRNAPDAQRAGCSTRRGVRHHGLVPQAEVGVRRAATHGLREDPQRRRRCRRQRENPSGRRRVTARLRPRYR